MRFEVQSPSVERIHRLRSLRDEAIEFLDDEQKNDKGEIRRFIIEKLKIEECPPDEQEEIGKRAVNRYVKNIEFGSSAIHGHIEAPHAASPEISEVKRLMREKFLDNDPSYVDRVIDEMDARVDAILAENPDLFISDAIEVYKQEHNDPIHAALCDVRGKFDEKTGEIVEGVSQYGDVGFLIARKSRLVTDMNRGTMSREAAGKNKTAEYLMGAREVQWLVMDSMIRNSCSVTEQGQLENPYLYLNIHGTSSEENDVVIGGQIRHYKAFSHPVILRWLQMNLQEELREMGIAREDGSAPRICVAVEGEKLSGATNLYNYRYGEAGHSGYGENLQVAQIEFNRRMRNAYGNETSHVLATLLTKFSEEFPDQEKLQEYILAHQTQEDAERLSGEYALQTAIDERIRRGQVGLSETWRNILGVKEGDTIEIEGRTFVVRKTVTPYNSGKWAVFSGDDTVSALIKVKSK